MMKSKHIFAIVTIAVILVSVFFVSGCATSVMLRNNDGHWVYEDKYEKSIKELSIDINKNEATVNIEFADDIEVISSNINSGIYSMRYSDVSYEKVTYTLTSESGSFSATISNYSITLEYMIEYKVTDVETEDIFGNYVWINLYKNGHQSVPNPDDPIITEETHFEEIKTAYADAGYDVDVEIGNIDPSLQSTVRTIKETYAALGYEMSIIGKNFSDPLSMEFFMLIKANDTAGADEIAEAYDGVYPYAQHGRDIIISLNFMSSSANFDPFNQVCRE